MRTNAQSALQRWGMWCATHARWVVLGWGVVLTAAALLLPRFAESLSGSSIAVSGSESARTEQLLEQEFDRGVTEDAIIVIASERLTMRDSEFQRAISEAAQAADDDPGVTSISDPWDAPSGEQVSEDGRTAQVLVGLTGDERERQELAPRLQTALDAVQVDDVTASLTGSSALNAAVVEQQDSDIARAESIGLPIALVVLLVAFGTLVAAGLPLLLGVLTLVTAFGALGALSFVTSFDVFVQAVVTMLGLALGIDYCLFVVTRFREELARVGPSNIPEAVGRTLATAGNAVLFSGSTVLISVSGLFLVQAPVFRSMSLGVMVAVAIMLALSTTLLPALLGVLGRRIDSLKVPGLARSRAPVDIEKSWWARWTRAVLRRPVVIGGATGAALILAAVPALGLKLGFDVGADAVSESPAGAG
ncbi:MMPL family transporter [Epidermidibacterium keratini]|uniref:MMPL family transporter n=1 Tax=Epidermidibacterium keratini TaxID=1891644 RepID=A0A7L4YPH2_9ACTN|nr:MMPL family transporter [Epidermidibacterium keratini]QHC00457.1 MMPL family transporter [Epidermidibacterium keratini]